MCFSFLFPKYPREFKAEVERLTENLISIGKKEDYLSVRSGGPFDQNCRHKGAREIGNRGGALSAVFRQVNALIRLM